VTRDSPLRHDVFAVATPGLEQLVTAELADLHITDLQVVDGGVGFVATGRQLLEANLHLRTASRVLVRLAHFRALTFAELERRARRIPWERVLRQGQRVALRVTCRKSRLYHSDAVAERIGRDLQERLGATVTASARDESDPAPGSAGTQLIIVRFDHDHCTVSADSSGAHLHERGYRTSVTEAPMRETLAAALIIASAWDRQSPLLDPFCGSGTIPIEAALMAAHIAPGRNRDFQFMNWPSHDPVEWERVRSAAIRREKREAIPVIMGSDRSASAIRAATENAERADVSAHIHFDRLDALRVEGPASPGWIVSNPPYGVRLGDSGESRRLVAQFGVRLRQSFGGWHLGLLATAQLQRTIGIPLETRLRTTNGGLRVQVLAGNIPGTPARSTSQARVGS
jgi:putative N6-adenine-specific DNA methylase